MAPSAIPMASTPETTAELTSAGVSHSLEQTAPSPTSGKTTNGPPLAPLDASALVTTLNPSPSTVPEPGCPIISAQKTCTDHMITVSWTHDHGWHAPHLQPYGPLSIMPTASVLHYATECFEGLKLYRGFDGKLRLFRPDRNTARMVTSATRIALPAFDPAELPALIVKLCATDGPKWLPAIRPGSFLYLRPTMIANDPALGVQRPKEALLYILLAVFPSMDAPRQGVRGPDGKTRGVGMRLLASKDDMVRAWPGGFGFAKVGANYGPSLVAHGEAQARGYDQILWLFGEGSEVTEAGASNFFVVWKTKEGGVEMVTAPLGERIILDGVTRRSVLELARDRLGEELTVVERKYGMREVAEAAAEGRLVEAFVAGTAFFITPVEEIHFRGEDLEIPMVMGESGRYTGMIKTWLKNIMFGKESHEWGYVVEEEGV